MNSRAFLSWNQPPPLPSLQPWDSAATHRRSFHHHSLSGPQDAPGIPWRMLASVGGGEATPRANLIHRETNGLHVPAKATLPAAVLLHEGQQEAAARLATLIIVFIVYLLQPDLELGVHPEGSCRRRGGSEAGGAGASPPSLPHIPCLLIHKLVHYCRSICPECQKTRKQMGRTVSLSFRACLLEAEVGELSVLVQRKVSRKSCKTDSNSLSTGVFKALDAKKKQSCRQPGIAIAS